MNLKANINMPRPIEYVIWEITTKCNINCIHCCFDCTTVPQCEELNTDQCLKVVEDLAKLKCKSVAITGGEALLRPDLDIIVSKLKEKNIYTLIVSNGYIIDEKIIEKIKHMGADKVSISLDAADSLIHDYIRGKKGSFEHALKAIKLLIKNNISTRVITTLHKLNFEQLPALKSLILANNVKEWRIQPAYANGRCSKDWLLTEAQYIKVAKFILKIKMTYPEDKLYIMEDDKMGYMSNFSKLIQPIWQGCLGGNKIFGICPDGSVKACAFRGGKAQSNVKQRALIDIWNDKNLFLEERNFDISTLSGYCASCEHAEICKGGCRCGCNINNNSAPYCLYKFEKIGFSSEEQSKLHFSKQELFALYNKIKEMPQEYLNI